MAELLLGARVPVAQIATPEQVVGLAWVDLAQLARGQELPATVAQAVRERLADRAALVARQPALLEAARTARRLRARAQL